MSENLGDAFEMIAATIEADAPAIICDGEVVTWAQLDAASNALGRALRDTGLGVQSKVGLYMRNGPDYLIGFVACLKARLAPFNINYRYGPAEIDYLFDNADCEAVIFDAEFASVLGATTLAKQLKARVSARGAAAGATALADVYRGNSSPLSEPRDPQDIFLTYTGGTTGMPKGVMWTSAAMWDNQLAGLALPGKSPPTTLDALAAQIRSGEGRVRFHIAPPLMHGTGLVSALGLLLRGGSVVMNGAASFDPHRLLKEIQDYQCAGFIIVGDAFARPVVDVLREFPGRYDLSSVRAIVSSGMMWSPEVKTGLLEFMPDAQLIDGLGASESSSFATSVTTRDAPPSDARFTLTGALVLRPDDLKPIVPGSGEVGILAKGGPLPLGYYKDPERTARTYVTIDGQRYVLGGDHATVEVDGSIRLLGRGSHCINTAGEKVYPEEVEEALKSHAVVRDALVFGVADPRFGQTVVAIASTTQATDPEALIGHVRQRLAAYKAPRRLLVVDTVPRQANGKADYPAAKVLFERAGDVAS